MMEDRPPIIARCTRCGRGFIWLNPASDMIDHYGPPLVQAPPEWGRRLGRMVPMFEGSECGGAIKRVDEKQ